MKHLSKVLFALFLLISVSSTSYASNSVPKAVLNSSASVFRIYSEYTDTYSLGTGFVVSEDSEGIYLVTNYHVISDYPNSIYVIDKYGNDILASVYSFDSKRDLAILKLSEKITSTPLRLNESGIKKGDAVYAVGFPGAADSTGGELAYTSEDATVTDGIVSSIREGTTLEGAYVNFIQISAPINSGNSGGPLFNAKGEVVGVNTYSAEDSQGIYWAISIEEIVALMNRKGLRISRSLNLKLILIPITACLLILILTSIIFILKRKKRKKYSCPHCNTYFPKESKFCKKCGFQRDFAEISISQIRFCKKCGQETIPGTFFCKRCGEKLY